MFSWSLAVDQPRLAPVFGGRDCRATGLPSAVLREIKSGRPGGTRTHDLSFIRALRCRSEQSRGEFGGLASTDYATDYLC